MNEKELREHICEIGKKMYDRDMVAANDGNISVRFYEGFLCTPTGVSKGSMQPDMICCIDREGKVTGSLSPSSELKMHLKVYKERKDVNAVIHAHPPYATTYAIANESLDRPITAEAVVAIGKVPLAEYGTPSTDEITRNIAPYLKDHNAILLANHGALTWGDDLTQAYMRMETVEFYARMMYQAEMLKRARELDADQLAKLESLKNL